MYAGKKYIMIKKGYGKFPIFLPKNPKVFTKNC